MRSVRFSADRLARDVVVVATTLDLIDHDGAKN